MSKRIKERTKVTALTTVDGFALQRTADASPIAGTDYFTNYENLASEVRAEEGTPVKTSDVNSLTALTLQADSNAGGTVGEDIIMKIGTKVVGRIPNTYAASLPTGIERDYYVSQEQLSTTIGSTYRPNEIVPAGLMGATLGYTFDYPSYLIPLDGYMNPYSPNFGNYRDITSDSILVYIPFHYIKIDLNDYYYASQYDYVDETAANAAGYFVPRAMVDGGAIIKGFFRDKYPHNSIENNIAVSKAKAIPITSNGAIAGYGFANCTGNGQTPTNTYGGAFAAAKSRGNDYYTATTFHDFDIFCLTKAHQQACTALDVTYCAYNSVVPYFPKGNNNNALKDVDDTSVVYTTAGNVDFAQRALTGSGSPYAKTTHNGQANGICDLNGNMYRVTWGLTSDGNNLYTLKESKYFKDMVDGVSGLTHAFDVTNYDSIGANPSSFTQIGGTAGWSYLGSGVNQVFSGETDRTQLNYKAANAGLPLSGGYDATGTDTFGKDGIYVPTAFPNYLCPLAGLYWAGIFRAGLACRGLSDSRLTSFYTTGTGSCLSLI